MYPHHAYDDDDLDDELPELPIPRPGEERAPEAVHAAPIQAPKLGGGASFTAAELEAAAPHEAPPVRPNEAAPAPGPSGDETRFTWELAARLTQGMLANPARQHDSVKDAMGIFDQFLSEMDAYTRIRGGPTGDAAAPEQTVQRRAEHGEYFQQVAKAAAPQPTRIFEPRPDPRITPAITTSPDPSMLPKSQPQQPRPPEGYRPLPPGARYVPGSMAGPSPDTSVDDVDDLPADERVA